jgi:hypothetical protein
VGSQYKAGAMLSMAVALSAKYNWQPHLVHAMDVSYQAESIRAVILRARKERVNA